MEKKNMQKRQSTIDTGRKEGGRSAAAGNVREKGWPLTNEDIPVPLTEERGLKESPQREDQRELTGRT